MTKPYGLQTVIDSFDATKPLNKDHFFETEEEAVAAARQFLIDNPDASNAAAHVLKVTRGDYTFMTFRRNGKVEEYWGAYESARKYRVTDVKTLEEFMNRYYKRDRYRDRGAEYMEVVRQSRQKDLDTKGFTVISRHDNVTGEPVAFYAPIE
jgi:hypothetical protein